MLRDGHELAVGGFRKLLQGVDRVAPLPIGQASFHSLQLGQGDAVGAVELHGLGEVEPRLGGQHADLRGGRRRNRAQNRRQRQRQCRRRPEASSDVLHWRPTMTKGR